MPPACTVRAAHCDHRSDDETVYRALERASGPLERAWKKLSGARRIAIKFNQDWGTARVVRYMGERQALVGDRVGRAVLRLLRERTLAELFAIDLGVEGVPPGQPRESSTNLLSVLREFGVPFVDGHLQPVTWREVPGGGRLFARYPVSAPLLEADALVSVQKLKNHLYTGVSLTLKNLFGLMPLVQYGGRPRAYYHHLVRLPYMLADTGRLLDPALNILDGLVCQAGEEWGKGEHPRIANTLIAGDQTVATDACAARLMGHDPAADWPTPPYHRDRNPLLVAAEGGFGTLKPEEIDFQSEVSAPVAHFFAKELDPPEMVASWRRTMAEQALFYREHQAELARRYAGQYILLQMGEVRWAGADGRIKVSRRELAGDHPEQAMFLKCVDPEEREGEHFEVYERTLAES